MPAETDAPAQPSGVRPVTLPELFLAFLRLGATAFGGPAIVAYIRDLAVNRRGWLDDKSFRSGVALCQSIPGATAMQTAAYVGLRARGVLGGLATYIGFGLPAFLLMLLFSVLYQRSHDLPMVLSLFRGLRAIVIALVANAAVTFGWSTLRKAREVVVAGLAAAALAFQANPILVIVAAGLAGVLLLPAGADPGGDRNAHAPRRGWVPGLLLVLLAAVAVGALFLTDRRLFELAATMLRIDLFAFGGGFASLPIMQHEVVNARQWLDARAFIDGVALGQVTPGPLVITATFVGYHVRALPGAVVGTISVFTPSFVLLVLTLPAFDRLQASPLFRKAVRGALLAFIGLLVSVAVRFGIAVAWTLPLALLGLAAFTALRLKVDMLWVVLVGGILSVLLG